MENLGHRESPTPPLRLAFLLNNLNGGGAERVAVTVANELAAMGHDVTIILNRKHGPYLGDVSEKVRLLGLGQRMRIALPALFFLLRREKFAVVLGVLDQPNIALLLLKPFIGPTRVIVTECNNPLAEGAAIRRQWVWRIIRALKPWLYPRADHVITKSTGIGKILCDHFGCRAGQVSVIHNPVDMARIGSMALEAPDHLWLREKKGPVLLAAGRLHEQKDYPTLLRALALLRRSAPARLIILGEGEERPTLEKMMHKMGLDDCVDMPGFTANPYAFLARADCYVMSSAWESWGNALVEALACGTPVVSTDCVSGPREILEDGKHGCLVPVGDAEALSAAILATLKDPGDAESRSMRACQFAPHRAAEHYLAVIERTKSRDEK